MVGLMNMFDASDDDCMFICFTPYFDFFNFRMIFLGFGVKPHLKRMLTVCVLNFAQSIVVIFCQSSNHLDKY